MARRPAKRLFAGGARFDPGKHPRAAGGRFRNVPGAGDDAPQGGKASDVTADDVMTFVTPQHQAQMHSRRGTAGARFQNYQSGMTVDSMIQRAGAAGVSREQVLSDLTWAHKQGAIRFDPSGAVVAPPGSRAAAPAGRPLTDAEALADPQRSQWIAAANAEFDANRHVKGGDVGLAKFMEVQGRHTSQVMDRAAFDQVKGQTILRGITSDQQVSSQYDQKNFYGVGIFGNGQYYGYGSAEGTPFSYASSIPPGHVWVSKLRAGAHTIDHPKLQREHRAFQTSPAWGQLTRGEQAFLGNEGRYAAWRGYDAIDVPSNDYMVVLNKSTVVVSKESLPGEAYHQQAQQPGAPDPALIRQRDTVQGQYTSYVQQMAAQAQAGQVMTSANIQTLNSYVKSITQHNNAIQQSTGGGMDKRLAAVFKREYGLQYL